ncbi:hypothetical protein ABPG72_008151 [Tetrahymena utriculariae]
MRLLEISKKEKKNGDYMTSKYLNNIGFCYLQLNQYYNSVNYYLESLELLQKQKEENQNLTNQKNQALLYLYINYQLLGDKQNAEQYRSEDPLLQKQAESEIFIFNKEKQKQNDCY